MSENIVEIQGVSKSFAQHTALTDVSLNIPKGCIFGLLGPNGAGKTTLIRIINRITAPDSGVVLFNGEPLLRKHVQEIGYLPEERGLYKKMKVGEQAVYLAQLKGMSKTKAVEALNFWFEKFEIAGWWNKKIEELSKGMAQKIQFIITIIHKPKLLILDEPFSGFDPINANLIKSEIKELQKQGTTVIFSTHNMESVEQICSRIALIHQSKKILEGDVAELKERFKPNVFNVVFKGSILTFTNALWAGYKLLHHNKLNEETVSADVQLLGENTPNNLLGILILHVQIISFREKLPSMNKIFIEQVSQLNDKQNEEKDVPTNTEKH